MWPNSWTERLCRMNERCYASSRQLHCLTLRLEEELTVLAAVLLSILCSDASESLADGASGFVGSQDTFAQGADGFGIYDEFFSVGTV